MATDKAHYVGEPVAAVAAVSRHVALQRNFTWGPVGAAFARAHPVFKQRYRWHRMGANPIETFGCICQWDMLGGGLAVRASVHAPLMHAVQAAGLLGIPTNKVKLSSTPRGGCFGGRSQAWDRHHEAQLAVASDGTVTGYQVRLIEDIGASGENYGAMSDGKPLSAFTGCYAIPAASYDLTIVLSNKVPTSACHGLSLIHISEPTRPY